MALENVRLGLTYNDVLLVPKRTPLASRSEAKIASKFTRNVSVNLPFVAANMASVCESKMAIALARAGAIGIIHQFCTIEEQAAEVRRVKRSTCYVIEKPQCVSPNVTIAEAIRLMEEKSITSLIVTSGVGVHSGSNGSEGTCGDVVGIFTHKDYQFEKDHEKLVSSVMTPRSRLVVAKPRISLEHAKEILREHRIEKLPLLDESGKLCGLITSKDIVKLETWSNSNRDTKGRLVVCAAVGVKDAISRATALVDAGVDVLCLDIAHCHSDFAISRICELKVKFPNIDLMAGNIATAAAAQDLIDAGVDGLKVGIGPSPVCTTRIMAGAGVPQLTAVMDVCSVASKFGIPVCADGGISLSGDIVKALAAGASTIMNGSKFSGCRESPGPVMSKNGKRYKRYMGSASYVNNHEKAEKMKGKRIRNQLNVHVEGVPILVDYYGPVSGLLDGWSKGLRSGISYCGSRDILGMQTNAEFIRITAAGWYESGSRGDKISD